MMTNRYEKDFGKYRFDVAVFSFDGKFYGKAVCKSRNKAAQSISNNPHAAEEMLLRYLEVNG
jgi:hypothetical protein